MSVKTNAFGLTKEEVWHVVYDQPEPRILNALSVSIDLVM